MLNELLLDMGLGGRLHGYMYINIEASNYRSVWVAYKTVGSCDNDPRSV